MKILLIIVTWIPLVLWILLAGMVISDGSTPEEPLSLADLITDTTGLNNIQQAGLLAQIGIFGTAIVLLVKRKTSKSN